MNFYWIHPTDLAIIVIILGSGLFSFFRGFAKEIVSIIAWLTAVTAGIMITPHLKPKLLDVIPNLEYAQWIIAVLIGLASFIFITVIGNRVRKRVSLDESPSINRSLGFLYGVIKGLVLVAFIFIGIKWFLNGQKHPSWISSSKSVPLIERSVDLVLKHLPPSMKDTFDKQNLNKQKTPQSSKFESLNLPSIKINNKDSNKGYSSEQRKLMDKKIKGLK